MIFLLRAAQNVFISLPSAGDHFKPIRSDLERDCSELLKLPRRNDYFGHTKAFASPPSHLFWNVWMLERPCGKVLRELLIMGWGTNGRNVRGGSFCTPRHGTAAGLGSSFSAGSRALLQLHSQNEKSLAQALYLYLASLVINYSAASEICGCYF